MNTELNEHLTQEEARCLNCDHSLHRKDKFCPNCGQKNNNGKVRMKELLNKFWTHLVHLDSKFVKVVWQLMIPGKVTVEYFKGRHKRYPHPVQFFFIIMFFFLLLFNKSCSKRNLNFNNTGGNFGLRISSDSTQKKQITGEEFSTAMEHYAKRIEFQKRYEALSPALRNMISQKALDTLLLKVYPDAALVSDVVEAGKESYDSTETALKADSITLNLLNFKSRVSISDLYTLTPDEMVERYKIPGWKRRMFFEQGIKSFKNPSGLMHTYLGSFAWSILVLIALMAGFLSLLYWRQKRYYVEHFVFLMHQHSGAFMVITLGLIINLFLNLELAWLLIFGWIGINLLLCMRNYYQQSWGLTILKWLLYLFIYLMSFILLFGSGLLLAFILF
ncbi:MAG: DUF3667 domain-containing protein [Bacteroidota bacterium]